MEIVFIVFPVLCLVVAGMAVGVIFSNRRIAGSCGGLNLVPGLDACPVCGRDAAEVADGGACGNDGDPGARDRR